jgi:predicted metal-dependent phosphoesterase TrpH
MDHNDIRGALDAMRCADYLKSRGEIPADFTVVPGAEINSTVGHVGALFLGQNLPISLEPADLVDAIHEAGGLAVAVHPYHSTGIRDAVFDAPFDAVEIECGSVFTNHLIERNRELISDPRLQRAAKLGASDAHYIRAMASCYTVIRNVETPSLEALKQAILDGSCEPRASQPYKRIASILGSVRKLK